MINDSCILQLNNYVLKRFEHNLNNGTIILFDVNSFDIWLGNESANDLIKLIDGKTPIKDIFKNILPMYKEYDKSEVISSFNSIIEELLNKHFIILCEN